ncbi:hypothetical protein COCNU_14G008610 [Cocos nucifera]|uniref:Uncharacterized protein n=1 Tax=Cocos nucifera TaxID=13894 RepID=A0A8K0IVR4_COCNU|nr:hypothetical protein COCNU_14G008610 [Cocos nucifera]
MSEKIHHHVAELLTAMKEQGNGMPPLVENNTTRTMLLPSTDNNILMFPITKGQGKKPELVEKQMPGKANSFSSTGLQIPGAPLLIPLPTLKAALAPSPPLPPATNTMGDISSTAYLEEAFQRRKSLCPHCRRR